MTIYGNIAWTLTALLVCCLAAAAVVLAAGHRNGGGRSLRKRQAAEYPEEFLEAASRAYGAAGSLHGMLLLLRDEWTAGEAGRRVMDALDYLEHSRYRDYETTLRLLSDGTERCGKVLDGILGHEIRKQRGLACKAGNTGQGT